MLDLKNKDAAQPAIETPAGRWSPQKALAWQEHHGWLCGFNFMPSTAVNFIDMWHEETFDPQTIDQELAIASATGFNSLRTNLQFVLWQDNRQSLHERIEKFLEIASRNNLKTVFCLFDDCGFSGASPSNEVQSPPVPGVHNSRAMASPGRDVVMDMAMRPELEAYVKDIISTYARDERVILWDLYNEPGNLMIFRVDGQKEFSADLEPYSLSLLLDCFEWARSVSPTQPITTGGWHIPMPWEDGDDLYNHQIDQTAFSLSDVISFHAYCDAERMANIVRKLKSFSRPLLCTEWMARSIGSNIKEQLPLLEECNVGAFQWGLVQGRSQTHIPWPQIFDVIEKYGKTAELQFHDLFDGNGRPFDETEVQVIGELTSRRALDERHA
ncbi:1,4-beta-xylanase [Litorivicinus lipolyticus]|uniref:1,4-beta-xylanase n=1 Tax=Litorivicinus lipolyticus TaxID=418701 RepID=UPI003B5C0F60